MLTRETGRRTAKKTNNKRQTISQTKRSETRDKRHLNVEWYKKSQRLTRKHEQSQHIAACKAISSLNPSVGISVTVSEAREKARTATKAQQQGCWLLVDGLATAEHEGCSYWKLLEEVWKFWVHGLVHCLRRSENFECTVWFMNFSARGRKNCLRKII